VTLFMDHYLKQYQKTKNKGYISIPVGNHDMGRINNRRSVKDLEIIMAFLLTFPGTPFLYYGDEIGMKHLSNTPNREGGYQPRIGARTPMQWTADQKDNGYLPIDTSKTAPNVAAQEEKKNSLLSITRQLIELRSTQPALAADAQFEVLYAEKNKYPFVFQRSKGSEKSGRGIQPRRARGFDSASGSSGRMARWLRRDDGRWKTHHERPVIRRLEVRIGR